jgi:plasmid maintenance system antidote protein VapI
MTNRTVEIRPVGERLAAIIDHYRLNKNTFAKMIGLSDNSLISRIINDPKRGMTLEMIQRIAQAFPDVNLKWLILDEGEITHKEDFPDPMMHYIEYYKGHDQEPTDLLRIHGYDDCDFAFDVYGDMMAPRYRAGDVILCREQELGIIQHGEAYFIIARKIPYIRYIKGEIDGEAFKIGAESPRHEDTIMLKKDIEKLYIIKGVIRREAF